MANRFWVGGTGSWSSSGTTNWSATSGGAGGASAPTSVDDVFFDVNSNTGTNPFTVTILANATCRSWDVSGLDGLMTIAGNTTLFQVYGGIYFSGFNLTSAFTGIINLRATSGTYFITTNGVTLSALQVNCTAVYRLGGNIELSGNSNPNINLISGTLNLNGWTATLTGTGVTNIAGSGSTSRTLTLTNSIVNCYSTSSPINLAGSNYGLGTSGSTINIYGSNATITESLAGSYNYVYFQSPSTTGTRSLATSSSFTTLRVDTGAVAGIYPFTISNNISVSVLQLVSISDAAYRHSFSSNVAGTTRTISSTFTYFLQNVDFKDITSASAVWSGTSIATLSNTVNITPSAAKTVYWNLAGTQNWSANGWATSSGGTPAAANFPIAQDTAVFDDSGAAGTITVNANYNLSTLNTSARTTAVTINASSTLNLFGSLLLGSGLTSSGALNFQGASTSSITSNSNTTGFQVSCLKNAGVTLQLLDNFSSSVSQFNILSGTFLTNNYNLSLGSFFANNSGTKTLSFGSSTISFNGSGTVGDLNGSNTTFSSNTATLSFNSASSKSFNSSYSFIFNSVVQNGAGTLAIGLVNCANISTNVLPTTISFNNTCTFTNFNLNGTPGNLVTLRGLISNNYSLRTTITTNSPSSIKTINYVDVASLQFESVISGRNNVVWYATNSTNSGNNVGILFSDTSKKAFYMFGGNSLTMPSDWNSNNNKIYLVGGGGSGRQGIAGGGSMGSGGGGGGGGFTLVENFPFLQNATLFYAVGAGGNFSNGGTTTWNTSGPGFLYTASGGAYPASANLGGAGGVGSTFTGGAGGDGIAFNNANSSMGSGGGGGSAGPLGNGGRGGNGIAVFFSAGGSGGGGGGNGGGSAGQNGASNLAGAGGNNFNGVGGGAASSGYNNAGFAGGGSSGYTNTNYISNNQSTSGTDIAGSFGTGGGAGGGCSVGVTNANNGFGGGGSGGGGYFGGPNNPGAGGQGIIVVEYTPNTDFLMFMNAR